MGAICSTENKTKSKVSSFPIEEQSRRPSNNVITQRNAFVDRKGNFRDSYIINGILVTNPYTKVYKVLNRENNEIRAMKMIKKKYFNTSIEEERNILYELETLSTMEHPNILKIFEYFNDFEYLYIITEIKEGEDLYKRIPSFETFTELEAANIMEQLFSAIFYMHSKGIIHRELRPDNIIIENKEDDSTVIKLVRYGLSAFCEKNAKISKCKEASYFTGPEVFDNKYTYKTDLWSCGVILYILLTGYPPFEGKDFNELKENIKNGKVSMDSKAWNDISKEAKNLITSLLRVDPAKRISAEEAWNGTWIKKYTKTRKSNASIKCKLNFPDFNLFAIKQNLHQFIYMFLLQLFSLNDTIDSLRNVFIGMNKNVDSKLSYEDLKEVFKKYYGDDLADNEIELLFKENNIERDQSITLDEFVKGLISSNQINLTQNFKQAFDAYDVDKKGKIQIEEIKQLLKIDINEEKSERNVIIEILKEIDNYSEIYMSFEELKEMMEKIVIK